MITNYRGWRARQEASRLRQAQMAQRWAINKERLDHYNRQAGVAETASADNDAGKEKASAINPENMSNADLRAALAAAGVDVSKQTPRARLIDLYTAHVRSA